MEEAIKEAVERTERALERAGLGYSLLERVRRVRDIILEHSHLKQLVSHTYIAKKLGCSEAQAEKAVERCLQLYPDLKGRNT